MAGIVVLCRRVLIFVGGEVFCNGGGLVGWNAEDIAEATSAIDDVVDGSFGVVDGLAGGDFGGTYSGDVGALEG